METLLKDIFAYTFAGVSFSSPGGESKNLGAQVVSDNYFDVLGVKAFFAVLCAFAMRILRAKPQRTAKDAKEQTTLPNQ